MKSVQIAVLCVLEILGLVMIVRLWTSRRYMPWFQKIIWTVLLLFPLIGLVLWGFTAFNPSAHSEDVGDFSSGGGVGDSGDF